MFSFSKSAGPSTAGRRTIAAALLPPPVRCIDLELHSALERDKKDKEAKSSIAGECVASAWSCHLPERCIDSPLDCRPSVLITR